MEEINRYLAAIEVNVGNIVASIQEQTAGLKETSSVIQQLDGATQQNAAMAEETSAAGQALSDQAEMLLEPVQRFKIDATDRTDGAVNLRKRRVA